MVCRVFMEMFPKSFDTLRSGHHTLCLRDIFAPQKLRKLHQDPGRDSAALYWTKGRMVSLTEAEVSTQKINDLKIHIFSLV